MDQALTMRPLDGVGNLNGVTQKLIDRQRAAGQPLRQRLTLQVLHPQEIDAVILTDVVESADMRMIQRGDGAGFALKPRDQAGPLFRALPQIRAEHLESDGAIQTAISRAVHFAHTAGAKQSGDFVRPQSGSVGKRHGVSIDFTL